MDVTYEWRGAFASEEVDRLHAAAFHHDLFPEFDWVRQMQDHSLGWVCARREGELVGFVNVAWDGAGHAFILDTMVADNAERQGVGTTLVSLAVDQARSAGCEWLHVDFEDHLRSFYLDACGFRETNAGLIRL